MCRTLETARLMFGEAEPTGELREGAQGDYLALKKLLAMPITAGSKRWMVGHGIPFWTVASTPHLAEGEAAVIRPEGTQWRVIARILPADWVTLKASTGL